MNVKIEDGIFHIAPQYVAAIAEATVTNAPTSAGLQQEIDRFAEELKNHSFDTGDALSSIKDRSGIKATRDAYKASGIDPSRYRPACEQLCRRILQGKGLYSIDTLVDIGNLLSLFCGYSIAVIDRDKLEGDTLRFGIGKNAEPYEAIGRGKLNIEHMPVWRDNAGSFATPTSDNVRTMCSHNTQNILVIINAFDGDKENLKAAIDKLHELLSKYADCNDFTYMTTS